MTDILVEIEKRIAPGSLIPKPNTDNEYLVKGWGRRRGERALIYTIPNLKIPNRPYEKGVTTSEWVQAYDQLMRTGEFARCWFRASMKACAKEAGCNYTTIGGIFERLGYARYEPGVYRKLPIFREDLRRSLGDCPNELRNL